jgi:fatty-acyl-CoA synthase
MASTAIGRSELDADRSMPLRNESVGGALRRVAAEAPDGLALVEGHPDPARRRRWTFAELLADAERMARALATRFEPGEHVAVWASSTPEWVVLEFATALAGIVLVTVNPALQSREVAYVLGQSKSAGLFYERSFRGNPMAEHLAAVRRDLPRLRHVVPFDELDGFLAETDPRLTLPDVDPRSPAQIQYTSGTTGAPKGALLSHAGITDNGRLSMELVGLGAGDSYLNCMPLFHTGGCVLGVLGPIQRLATCVCLREFNPELMLDLCEAERVTHFLAVPTMLVALLAEAARKPRDLSSLRLICSGAAPVPAELVRRVQAEFGVEFAILFGQTEAAPVITMTRPDDKPEDIVGTLGTAIPQVAVKIVDPVSGETVPVDTVGELCAKGFNVMLGYYDMPERTAETIDADGWLHTGDLATMDERGYFRIAGRLKDMIIRGGENIYPVEVEEVLFRHPGVAEVAVVGLPDETWGEVVAAFVRDADPAQPVSDDDLRAWMREHLAPHKTPAVWVHVEAFPLTPWGKIQKFALGEAWVTGSRPRAARP